MSQKDKQIKNKMKKILFIAFLGLSLIGQAQRGNGYQNQKDLTPEQQAVLKTKKMSLHLDLNKQQQDELLKVNQNWAEKRDQQKAKFKAQKDGGDKPDADARYAMQVQMLDFKMEYQNQIKKILDKEQYETWKKHLAKHGDRGRHGKKSHGDRNKDRKEG